MSLENGLLGMAYGAKLFGIHDQPASEFGFLPAMAGQAGYFVAAFLAGISGFDILGARVASGAVGCALPVFGDGGDGFAMAGSFPHLSHFRMARLT